MPVVPSVQIAPYDSAADVLDVVRVRMNDATNSLGGDTIKNDQPFTRVAFNSGWRRLQKFLATLGYTRLVKREIISALPVAADLDPTSQNWIDWSNFFDGDNFYDAPLLPEDLILPLLVGERPTGMNWGFSRMENMIDGMPSVMKEGRNRIWEWRDDKLLFPGALSSLDLEVRYVASRGKFVDTLDDAGNTVPWYTQPVRIVGSTDALAYYVCYEFAAGRGDGTAEVFQAKAEQEARQIFTLEVRQKQRTNIRRISRSAGARGDNNWLF